MKKLTEIMTDFVMNYSLEKMPAVVYKKAAETFKDCFGCMVAGLEEPAVIVVRNYATSLQEKAEATVFGGEKRSVRTAVLVNATAAHIHDYDDVSITVTGHPSVVMMPTALAVGEAVKADGHAVLEAYAVGVEVMALMGRCFNPEHYSKGWHNTATLGIFGAVATAGKLYGLTKEQFINAFSIAASSSAGLKGNFGTMTKSLHAGLAASNGIFAVQIAKMGLDANPNIFEMNGGFMLATTEIMHIEDVCQFIADGKSEFIHSGLAIKPFPSCKGTHNGINAAMILKEKYNFNIEDIDSLQVECQPIAVDLLKYPMAKTPLEGKFSMNYCIACGLLYGKVGLANFEGETIDDQAILDLMKKITMEVNPEIADGQYFNGTWETAVKINLKDGRKVYERVRYATGDPENPLSIEQCDIKFKDCIVRILNEDYLDTVALEVDKIGECSSIGMFCDKITACIHHSKIEFQKKMNIH